MRNAVKNILKSAAVSAAFAMAAPLLAQAAPIDVPAGEYVLDKTHASVTWKISHFGLSNYTGRFFTLDSTVNLDPKDPTRSTVVFTVDPNSVRTDYPFPEKENFDKKIATTFFQSEKFPTISFKSTKLEATGAKTGKLTGDLTFLGVTKPVTLDVVLNGAMVHPMMKVPVLGISATGTFKRSDFGMTAMQGPLGDEITLIIETEYRRK